MRYKYLLLDADGTFLDFNKAEEKALGMTFEQAGLETSPNIVADYNRINKQMWEALERGEITRERLRSLRFEKLGEIYPQAGGFMAQSYVENLAKCVFFLDGGEDFLKKASEICDIAVVTNGITSVQTSRLGLINVDKYAKTVVISDQCGVSKPDKSLAHIALERLGCTDKKQALIVGDSVSADVQLGINSGIDTCLVFAKSHLSTYCADSYEQVLSIIKG